MNKINPAGCDNQGRSETRVSRWGVLSDESIAELQRSAERPARRSVFDGFDWVEWAAWAIFGGSILSVLAAGFGQ